MVPGRPRERQWAREEVPPRSLGGLSGAPMKYPRGLRGAPKRPSRLFWSQARWSGLRPHQTLQYR
eukprot:4873081-Pyramimonas_sp.AAC.1